MTFRHRLQRQFRALKYSIRLRRARAGLTQALCNDHFNRPLIAERIETLNITPNLYRRKYLIPLLQLLTRHVVYDSEISGDVYLDERMRMFWDPGPSEHELDEIEVMIEQDSKLIATVMNSPDAAAKIDHLHAKLHNVRRSRPLLMLTIGDCVMTEMRAVLAGALRRRGHAIVFEHAYFSASGGTALRPPEQMIDRLQDRPVDFIAISFLTFRGLPAYHALLEDAARLHDTAIDARVDAIIGVMRHYLEGVRGATHAPIFLHNASGLFLTPLRKHIPLVPPLSSSHRKVLEKINSAIAHLVEEFSGIIPIDETLGSGRALKYAARRVFPVRMARERYFHQSNFGSLLADQYADVIDTHQTFNRMKVLAVDFDNTLWAGVMAEGPVVHDQQAQHELKALQEAGILLVSVSKNEPSSIRWAEILLQPEDFVLHKIGRQLKATSIEQVAKQLNLGLDSIVLIDDSPTERGSVARALPMVATLDPSHPKTWRDLELVRAFAEARRTREAKHRTASYRAGAERREAAALADSYEAMMKSLDLRVEFHTAMPDDLHRVQELLLRTNQFHTATLRPTTSEIRRLTLSAEHGVYIGSVQDRYEDMGAIIVIIVRRTNENLVIENLAMSCRAMGYGLEYAALRHVLDAEEWLTCHAALKPTERNFACRELFATAGFKQTDLHTWTLHTSMTWPNCPPWLEVNDSLSATEPADR